jgi:hypothetical protein
VSSKCETALLMIGVPEDLYFNTEFGSMPQLISWKNCIVINPSRHIGMSRSLSNFVHCGDRNAQLQAVPCEIGANRDAIGRSVVREIEVLRKITCINSDPAVSAVHASDSRRMTNIPPHGIKYPFDYLLRFLIGIPC